MPEQPTADATPSTAPDADSTPTTPAPAAPVAPGAPSTPDADGTPAGATAQPAAGPAGDATAGTFAAPSSDAPVSQEPATGSKGKKILAALGTVAVVLAGKFALGYVLSDKPAADSMAVGECVQRGDDDSISTVDCGDSKAAFKIVFIKKDTLQSLTDATCAPYEATTTTYFESREGETLGNTICLGSVR